MMEKADHGRSAWDAECIKEMNEAPGQAREALKDFKQAQTELQAALDADLELETEEEE